MYYLMARISQDEARNMAQSIKRQEGEKHMVQCHVMAKIMPLTCSVETHLSNTRAKSKRNMKNNKYQIWDSASLLGIRRKEITGKRILGVSAVLVLRYFAAWVVDPFTLIM